MIMRALAAVVAALFLVHSADAAPQRVMLPDTVVPADYTLAIVPDADKASFTGKVEIAIDVREATPSITLNAADLVFDTVSLNRYGAPQSVSFNESQQTATLTFNHPVKPGRHVLTIAYHGKIFPHAAGLFALDYQTPDGKKRALFTQFENSDARRFLPCWDEPARKATFTLSATVPDGQMAISNMPIARSVPAAGGKKTVTFRVSPRMSSYLLFFALGDFERISKTVEGVDVGVVVTRGNTAKGAYALDAAAHILPYYNNYFGIKFPLPKLDLIAGPGESQFFGAMENWGAIFYFDRALLIDPATSTEGDRRGIYTVIAHEMAHQWFGDLVTMAWWDDLWLNEGFASWMQVKATDQFHPEWKLWLSSQQAKEAAMTIDARDGTHPIIQPIADVLAANEAFDTITYEKGQAVIRMLEDYTGADNFRAGVRRYIAADQYRNAVTDDLWRALDAVQKVPVTQIAHDFTLQSGVPLIKAEPVKDGIRLTQDRFTADGSGPAGASWRVPVIVTALPGNVSWRGVVTRGKPVDVPMAAGATAIINAGQAGYFRTEYAAPLLASIAEKFATLPPADQMGLLSDTRALGYAGYAPLSDFLALTGKLPADAHPLVLAQMAGQLGGMADLYRGLPGQKPFEAYVHQVLAPVFAQVGWRAKPGEGPNVAVLRAALLNVLSLTHDPAVIAAAQERFAAFVKAPESLSAEERRSVLQIVGVNATAESWEAMHRLAKEAKSPLAASEYYRYLGLADDETLARKALDLTLTDEVPVTFRPTIISFAAFGSHAEMAFDFAVAHLDQVNSWLEPDSRNQFEARLAGQSLDAAMIPKLKAFAALHIPPTAMKSVTESVARIAYVAKVRKDRLPDVDAWLAARK